MRRYACLLRLSCRHKILEDGGIEVDTVVLPDGEAFKSLEVLTKILDKALSARLDRKTTFVALGGGVIGDMAGFAAAIYQRGVKFVQVRRRGSQLPNRVREGRDGRSRGKGSGTWMRF